MRPRSRLRATAPLALGTLFAASSVLHAVRPGLFRPLVPARLPAADALIYASGACTGC